MQTVFTSSATCHFDYVFAEERVMALHVKNGSADSLYYVLTANARLYDPVIGRFFSPDPFVQMWLGNLLRYSTVSHSFFL